MWDERYSVDEYVYGREPNEFLRRHCGLLPAGGNVLCLGEGEGRNAVFLARLGHRVTAVDASAVGLAKGRNLAAERGVSVDWVAADLADYDLGQSLWDGVLSIFCHLPAVLRKAVHRRVSGALKPGGVMLLEAYTPAQIGRGTGGPSVAEMMMSAADLAQEFADLDIERLDECERPVVEGRLHTGLGAVVQLIARRSDAGT